MWSPTFSNITHYVSSWDVGLARFRQIFRLFLPFSQKKSSPHQTKTRPKLSTTFLYSCEHLLKIMLYAPEARTFGRTVFLSCGHCPFPTNTTFVSLPIFFTLWSQLNGVGDRLKAMTVPKKWSKNSTRQSTRSPHYLSPHSFRDQAPFVLPWEVVPFRFQKSTIHCSSRRDVGNARFWQMSCKKSFQDRPPWLKNSHAAKQWSEILFEIWASLPLLVSPK
jgi:hypothetical protein